MRISRFYEPGDWLPGQTVMLDEGNAHQIIHVLRLKENYQLKLFNGDNQEADAIITALSRHKVTVQIQSVKAISRESHLITHLGQAISKGDRMDFTIQKAVELGVSEIHPIISSRTEVKLKGERLDKKMAHWEKVIISACSQCGRNQLPKLHRPVLLGDWVAHHATGTKILMDLAGEASLKKVQLTAPVSILVGPEGGLEVDEIELAKNKGFQGVQLGPRVLRTETAALTILSSLQLLAGDL